MSYKITARIFQNQTDDWFSIVEKTVWNYANGGTWGDIDGQQVLTMGGSGTSGVLRLCSVSSGEKFIIALGVHNYQRWCDIVSNLKDDETAVVLHPQYYNAGPRAYQREKLLPDYSVTNNRGRMLSIKFGAPQGNDFNCNITIGPATK